MSSEEISIIDSHKDKIYPWVKVYLSPDEPDISEVQVQFTTEDSPIRKEWLGNLVIIYVADMGERFQVILKRDLPENFTEEDLYELAVDNLSNVEFKIHKTNFGAHGLAAGGDHEAAAICLPAIWDYLADNHNDNLIVAIPSKDLVAFVSERDEDNIANLKIFVHNVFQDCERLLTRNIFKYHRYTKEWSIIDRVNK